MSEEKKKILDKINEAIKSCEEKLLQRLQNETNDNQTHSHFLETNENRTIILEENLSSA